MIRKSGLIILVVLFAGSFLQAQLAFSPYTRYGLGDILDPGSSRNFAMGGTGIALYDPATINRMNPASYGDLKLTSFDFNIYGGYHALRTIDSGYGAPTGGLHNVSFGFSSRKNFGIVFGLAPYSSSNYTIITHNTLLVDTTETYYHSTYKETGGINQFYLGAGFRLWHKLSLGFNAAYAFGNTQYRWQTSFDSSGIKMQDVNIRRRVSLNGFIPQAGIQFGDTLRFTQEVDLVTELKRQEKNLDQELKYLATQDSSFNKRAAKERAKEKEMTDEKNLLADEIHMIEENLKPLMENERANEKVIGKMQERKFKLDKKRKKLDQKIKQSEKELSREKVSLVFQHDRIDRDKAQIKRKLEEVARGDRDKTVLKTNKILARLGMVYQPAMNIHGTRLVDFNNTQLGDTVGTEITDQVLIPSKWSGGFSFGVGSKWTIAADVCVQDWSQFKYFGDSIHLKNSMRVSIGGEYIPRMLSSRYSERIAWRAGAWFENTNLTLNGTAIHDFGFSFGMGLPLGRMLYPGAVSRINFGIGFGNRGTLRNNLLKETYVTFRLGLNLNDVWFLRTKID